MTTVLKVWLLSCHLIQKASTILHGLWNKDCHLRSCILRLVLCSSQTGLFSILQTCYRLLSSSCYLCHSLCLEGPLLPPYFCRSSTILCFGVQLKCTSFIKPSLISYTDTIYSSLNSEITFIPLYMNLTYSALL